MELIQKLGKWKYNDEYQAHVTVSSSTESDDIVEQIVHIEDLEEREVYICIESNEPGTEKEWCQHCNARRVKKNFKNWTSEKKDIDELIQNSQINTVHSTKFLEWIPYENLQNIVNINEESSSKIYSAYWPEGNIYIKNKEWRRYSNNGVTLYEKYDHLFVRKVSVCDKLIIDDLKLATSTQTVLFKSLLTWAYSLVKYNKENPFTNPLFLDFFNRIRLTVNGEDLNSYDKFIWMMNLYKNNIVDINSYNDLILRFNKSSSINEKQLRASNFKVKLSFENWAGYANLIRWINENHLFQGLTIDELSELKLSKRMAINFTTNVDSSNKFCMKMMKPTTKIEEFLTSNNIFSIEDIRSFPFIKEAIKSGNISYKDYEKYSEITSYALPSEEFFFKQAIEKALESMKPLMCLQNVFDEYEHFFPLNVVLGKSLKNISPNSSMSYTETLNLHSDSLSILTNGNMDDSLETIEFDDIISSFDILEVEQKRKIEGILNRQNDLKIIMTGIEELKDLDVNNTEHYKRINIKPSLEDENYKVFGSVISRNNLRLRDILISFELYDFNGFYAMIKTLNNTDIDIRECFILWMIIGNPSKLSVFSPRNRELQVYCFKGLITLQHNNSCYPIKTPCQLSEGELKKYSLNSIGHILTKNTEVIPFTKVVPLISEIENNFNEIVKLTQAAEHNKRTCEILKERIQAINLIVLDLRSKEEFFNNINYFYMKNLINIITQIKNFISDISQMNSLIKYIKAKNIEKIFEELCEEFDSCVNLLSFSINVNIDDELEQLKADQVDLFKYLQEMAADIVTDTKDTIGITTNVKDIGDEIKASLENLSNQFSTTVVKVNTMNKTMENFMNSTSHNQTKIDYVFRLHPLKLSDYKQDNNEELRKYGRVSKWISVRNGGDEFAFKLILGNEDLEVIQNRVTILKELHEWENIIKFYGLVPDKNKWYIVTEWAEYGNLREFYTNHKDRFDLRLKLRVSLDIARGLNFLRTVEIIHRDIRAKNVLITINETAKLTNIRSSRDHLLLNKRLVHNQNLERARYQAPELLFKRAPGFKYDQKCDVYSFGILLWEIAEERIPYKDTNDITKISDKVYNKMYREPFSENSQMPEEFKQLQFEESFWL
ncbi:hypothetical protein GLOIN_2v1483159 [Rhizophagus irregularis DAOM 181602=DAOM 197198]|uniref:Protein kinase domain-containing protein n=1 Tax=Rhizophagus irregularis (strain DAOM 181602 / DAOM 197198 / MUCL 43194) TaxID=747089 RepID=A0A2P4PJ24_RHIID|nr:hypothetical protein GLOIN_2v1483159 [Rhizophagus irregularis DAOM 181602=DAOM 197198]POG65395.1 hypothetical protein GLOIN_2v1483159 [Rhizophagus irregularis DAOM 181602=DAOM 197198]|eukprot:XP_025172261.1 hypothetical protein GLOIN_2v1483159 [Rhizophagus irregularis DAOM 181602=DAOM 197198]